MGEPIPEREIEAATNQQIKDIYARNALYPREKPLKRGRKSTARAEVTLIELDALLKRIFVAETAASQARETDVSGVAERVFDADANMADGEVRMTAAEDVLAWLLIEKLGCLDDRNYTPNEAQTILAYRLDAAREMEEKLAATALSGQGWRSKIEEADLRKVLDTLSRISCDSATFAAWLELSALLPAPPGERS